MCIRDSDVGVVAVGPELHRVLEGVARVLVAAERQVDRPVVCLLYTSDAADERSSVDLGGRRIIKKKKDNNHRDVHEHDLGITLPHASKTRTPPC